MECSYNKTTVKSQPLFESVTSNTQVDISPNEFTNTNQHNVFVDGENSQRRRKIFGDLSNCTLNLLPKFNDANSHVTSGKSLPKGKYLISGNTYKRVSSTPVNEYDHNDLTMNNGDQIIEGVSNSSVRSMGTKVRHIGSLNNSLKENTIPTSASNCAPVTLSVKDQMLYLDRNVISEIACKNICSNEAVSEDHTSNTTHKSGGELIKRRLTIHSASLGEKLRDPFILRSTLRSNTMAKSFYSGGKAHSLHSGRYVISANVCRKICQSNDVSLQYHTSLTTMHDGIVDSITNISRPTAYPFNENNENMSTDIGMEATSTNIMHQLPHLSLAPDDSMHLPKDDINSEVEDLFGILVQGSQGRPDYEDLGDPIYTCTYCGAKFWKLESIKHAQNTSNPIFSLCCSKGNVQLPMLTDPPQALFKLFFDVDSLESKDFLEQCRAYNSMFAFTSMGGRIDRSANDGRGRFVFRLSGQNHHKIGSLLPVSGESPKFAQLYIYDTANEVTNRMKALRKSGNALDLNISTVLLLKQMLDEHNRLAKTFRRARDTFMSEESPNVRLRLIRKRNTDARNYNLPTASEIAGLIVGDIDFANTERDIIVQTQTGDLQRIDELHPLYLPLQYPLLFPFGEDGFVTETLHSETSDPDNRKRSKLTMREFFAFRLQERDGEVAVLLYARRLFQQFVVDAYTMIESQRLSFIRHNQKKLRADLYKGVADAILRGERNGATIGKRIVLPSSFTGGARYMVQNYQDAMAICKWAGYPDLFVTFTCNPNWPEVKRFMDSRNLKPEDRPDIISRIFKMKLTQLIKDFKSGNIFGKLKAIVYTVEFQKRGLPHCHILLFLANGFKHQNAEDIDKIISAEIPDKETDTRLFHAVEEFMVHGPCGSHNFNSPCMQNNTCAKFYPKDYAEVTTVDDDGYPVYRRRANDRVVMKKDIILDNRWIVPYNPLLLLKYQSHINVERCNQSSAIKYLFKYINKGSDRVTAVLSDSNSSDGNVDEIKQYYDCRYISACEAAWRIFAFDIQYRQPAVMRLSIHLPNEQSVIYEDNDDLESVLTKDRIGKTMFLAWMEANEKYPDIAMQISYVEFPMHFVYKPQSFQWSPRKQGFSVGRLFNIPMSSGELYYLSILVTKVKGPKSYEDIRTVNGTVYPTFRDACYALGLLDDDKEFIEAIIEASHWGSGIYLRHLFVTMLFSNSMSRPELVWEKTWNLLCEDMVYHHRNILQRRDIHFSQEQIQNFGLCEIEQILRSNGRTLQDFPQMPLADRAFCRNLANRLIVEQLNYDKAALAEEFKYLVSSMTKEQKYVLNTILTAVSSGTGGFFFLSGYGGTGKTYVWTALTSFLRSQGEIVLTVASSGIASTLLPGGRTAHSRFSIPIAINDESTCNISQGSPLAELLCKTKLIIWDEAPMMKKQCFEALDRSLRDILQHENPDSFDLPFGGKCVVLGGDFRQILPVIPNGSRSDIVFASINSSYLWSHCKVLKLTQNMRLQMNHANQDVSELKEFADWILKVGDGKLSEPNDGQVEIDIPSELLITDFNDPIEALMESTYPDFLKNYNDGSFLKDRAILAPTHDVVEQVNNYLLSKVPGEEKLYLSADSVVKGSVYTNSQAELYSVDFLNSIKCSGLPNHELALKVGVPIMLLRNVDQSAGLCNGTRLIVTNLGQHVLEALVITGSNFGKKIFLPRMNMTPSETKWPFQLQRRQFPITISYCMTINKSQGQSLSSVGLYLPKPVFSHGQLYVAISRVKTKQGLKMLTHDKEVNPKSVTDNVVFKEVLHNI